MSTTAVPTLPVLPIADILTNPDPPVSWLIPGFVPVGSLIALAGEPGAGKSFMAYTLSLALATGTDVLGFEIARPRRVLYFEQENSRPDLTQYLRWAWHGLGRPDPRLAEENLFFAHFVLGGSDWQTRAAGYVSTFRPELIVIDTTTPACHIQDENDNAEATRAVTAIRKLQTLTIPNASVIALKHARIRPEDGGYTLRGAKAWEGAVDAVIFHAKLPGRPVKGEGLRPTKIEPHKTRAFGLREPFKIMPRWTDEERRGIVLERRGIEPKELGSKKKQKEEDDDES